MDLVINFRPCGRGEIDLMRMRRLRTLHVGPTAVWSLEACYSSSILKKLDRLPYVKVPEERCIVIVKKSDRQVFIIIMCGCVYGVVSPPVDFKNSSTRERLHFILLGSTSIWNFAPVKNGVCSCLECVTQSGIETVCTTIILMGLQLSWNPIQVPRNTN